MMFYKHFLNIISFFLKKGFAEEEIGEEPASTTTGNLYYYTLNIF